MPEPIKIFISYASEDERVLTELESFLSPLKREDLITYWHKGKIYPGTDQEMETTKHLQAARIVLLLISPAFLASDDCYKEMLQAMKRRETEATRVIPVLLRPVHWENTPIGKLEPLPKNRNFVNDWSKKDKAFYEIAEGIRKVVRELVIALQSPSSSFSSGMAESNASNETNPPNPSAPRNRRVGTSPPQGTTLYTNDAHARAVLAVAWSPDGTRIVSGGVDGTARVWNPVTRQQLLTYHGHSGLLSDIGVLSSGVRVAWSCDSTRIASVGDRKTVHVWEAGTGRDICIYHGHSIVLVYTKYNALAWSPDSTRIASACKGTTIDIDRKVHVWDTTTGRTMLHGDIHSPWLPEFSVRVLAWSPDGKRIAAACSDKTIQVLDAATGDYISTYRGHTGWISSIAWSPDSRYLASASGDRTVKIWDTTKGKKESNVFTYHGHSGDVRGVAWSPDGLRIASASHDKTVHIWNPVTGSHIFTYRGHSDLVYTVTWSPDGTRIASAGRDKTVQVWQAIETAD